jgi:hypothetical protein
MISDLIQKMIDRIDLTEQEAREAMETVMAGQASDAEIAGFLTALRMKGETAPELIGFARVMRERAEPFWDVEALPVLDTAGTGGDRCSGRRDSGCKAWKPIGRQPLRKRRCHGSSRDRHPDADRSPARSS